MSVAKYYIIIFYILNSQKKSLKMLKHVAKIDKNIKTHFTSSNKYFIKHNIYPKRDKMKHILRPEKKESPYYITKGKVIDI